MEKCRVYITYKYLAFIHWNNERMQTYVGLEIKYKIQPVILKMDFTTGIY